MPWYLDLVIWTGTDEVNKTLQWSFNHLLAIPYEAPVNGSVLDFGAIQVYAIITTMILLFTTTIIAAAATTTTTTTCYPRMGTKVNAAS